MCTIIHGIPVIAGSSLPWPETSELVSELVQEWAWEGRELGRIELMSDGQSIRICAYTKPVVKLVPIKTISEE